MRNDERDQNGSVRQQQAFNVAIPEQVLADLRERLARTRWIEEMGDGGWAFGLDVTYMRELVSYWQHEFDWRAAEAAMNRFAHFQTDLNGRTLHFIHERGQGPNPLPIILTHGFPDSFLRFAKLIPMLTDPHQRSRLIHSDASAPRFDPLNRPSAPSASR